MSIQIGDIAPIFTILLDDGRFVTSEFYKNNKNIILYFYPKDDTPGCTMEAANFRDAYKEISSLDAVVIGVSKDNVKSHENFKKKYNLPFHLIADTESKLIQAYDVLVEKSMFNKTYMGIDRSTFLIDKEGIIRKIWRNVKVTNHVSCVIEEIKQL
ncbi:peroxiredoxin [Neoehrlichia mikurensis]|uniref:thioredoxin-dependent peroxiredoxin n=1 Tax=Neoehrlichia mikurensis TaxID=89586 RepID=A0ABY5EXN3_9RICK|nr:peroxiredoxin [Neoehrlichia mikurensis]QXK91982.1 peroxiredoxin [Neoehrlichia mikurensis]QXK92439.1 peroxiredoxin [Neoehrlichia mikurensis]QXK93674.1 peroxiredoxin [Neoehrlichia mikurensis]UTO56275.1 peroxiredoxin [Neoehrlichia mikurensis]